MVNFVKQARAVMYKMEADSRIQAYHISLYWALFQTWNEHRFQSPIRVYRDDIMSRAKILSRHTYAKYMQDLSEWEYIIYDSDARFFGPSLLVMRRFDGGRTAFGPAPPDTPNLPISDGSVVPLNSTTDDTSCSTSEGVVNDTSHDTTGDTSRDTTRDTSNINSINNTNILNNLNAYEQAHTFLDFGNDFAGPVQTSAAEEKSNARGGGGRGAAHAAGSRPEARPTSLDDVCDFFASLYSPRIEAEKFFHYFSSNGWKVGGRSDMRDWRAAARNWVLNAKRYNAPSGPTPGSLASPGPQNYAEPL